MKQTNVRMHLLDWRGLTNSFKLHLVGVYVAGVFFFYFVAFLFGAPLLEGVEKTMVWAGLMSMLTFLPLASLLPNRTRNFLLYGSQQQMEFPDDILEEGWEIYVWMPALFTTIGSWFGVFPIPLDWGQPWQVREVCIL